MGKVTDEMVADIPLTTDVLCSPGKYTHFDYKVDDLYIAYGNTWGTYSESNLPPEVFGIALNGMLLA